jgi:hypothetical protein
MTDTKTKPKKIIVKSGRVTYEIEKIEGDPLKKLKEMMHDG